MGATRLGENHLDAPVRSAYEMFLRNACPGCERFPDERIKDVIELLDKLSPKQQLQTSLLAPRTCVERAVPWLPQGTQLVPYVYGQRVTRSLFTSFRASRFGRNRLPDPSAEQVRIAMTRLLNRVSVSFLYSHLEHAIGEPHAASMYEASLSGFVLTECVLALMFHERLARDYLDAMLECYRHGVHLLGLDQEESLVIEARAGSLFWEGLA